MAFDIKGMAKSSAFATAGGVVLGLGIFWILSGFFEHLIRPWFNFIFSGGVVKISTEYGVYLGCGAFLSACIICAAAVAVGACMIKMAGKS